MSIAYQLSTQLPDYAGKLAGINLNQLLSDPNVNATALFDALIIQPLAPDIQRPLSPRIILIDGLDEATTDGRNLLAEFIAAEFTKLPEWLRIIITSRPDPEVKVPLQGWDRWILETGDPNNRKDLELYINSMLYDFAPGGISEELLNVFIENSEGIFLYAEWVCREIRAGRLSIDSHKDFPKGLGGIYDEYFKKKLTRQEKYGDDIKVYKQNIRPVFELIIGAREPLPVRQVSQWLGWNRYDEESFFKDLGSLFFLDPAGCIRPFHTSVLDWLGDPEKAGEFFVNAQDGNQRLTNILWAEYLQNGVSSLSVYALRFLPVHLIQAGKWDDAVSLLCSLEFIQAKAAARMTYELINDFNALMLIIPDNQDNIRIENERQDNLNRYVQNLILYSKGDISGLTLPESVAPWSEKETDMVVTNSKKKPGPLETLKSFSQFLGHEAGNLQNYAPEIPGFATQQAWNNYVDGPVGIAATRSPKDILDKLLLRPLMARPAWNPLPPALKTLTGHSWYVLSIAMTGDEKQAVSSSYDKTCILWDLPSGKPLKTLRGHKEPVDSVSITPDGRLALSGSRDKTCILWDLQSGKPLKALTGHHKEVSSVAITPDGKRALSGSEDKTCILWDLQSGEPLKILEGHGNDVSFVAITPDGKQGVSASWDETCIHWDLESGIPINTLRGHTDRVKCVAITPDGKLAISASNDGTCILWNLQSGKLKKRLYGHKSSVQAVAITPDGKLAFSGSYDNACILWDLQSGKPLKTFTGHTARIKSIAIAADGKRALSASWDETCILWDLQSGKPVESKSVHADKINGIAVTPNGQQALAVSKDNSCSLWDLQSGTFLKTLSGHTDPVNAITITTDGTLAVSASHDRTGIVWDLAGAVPPKILKGHSDPVNAISITPDGKYAVSASWEHCILWDLESGEPLKTLTGHSGKINAIAVSPDGKYAISASNDKTCMLWDLQTGEYVSTLTGHTAPVNNVVISPDGKLAVSVSWDKTGILWNMLTGSPIKTLTGHKKYIHSAVITPDGKQVLTASWDICILWGLPSGELLKTFTGHKDKIKSIGITPSGKLAVTVSEDKTAILWDLQSGKRIAQYIGTRAVQCLALSNDGLVLGGVSGEIIIMNLPIDLI
jgi:WD40 repeat protein